MNFKAYSQRVLFFFSFCDPKMTSHFSGLKAISKSLSQDSSLVGLIVSIPDLCPLSYFDSLGDL